MGPIELKGPCVTDATRELVRQQKGEKGQTGLSPPTHYGWRVQIKDVPWRRFSSHLGKTDIQETRPSKYT